MKKLLFIFVVNSICLSCQEKKELYNLQYTYFYRDGNFDKYAVLKDSFYAKDKIDAFKKATKIIAIKTKDIDAFNGQPFIYDSNKKLFEPEDLSEKEKKELRTYIKPILDSLGLK